MRAYLLVILIVFNSTDVQAADGGQLPEPSNLLLFGLGLLGLVIGRQVVGRNSRRDED